MLWRSADCSPSSPASLALCWADSSFSLATLSCKAVRPWAFASPSARRAAAEPSSASILALACAVLSVFSSMRRRTCSRSPARPWRRSSTSPSCTWALSARSEYFSTASSASRSWAVAASSSYCAAVTSRWVFASSSPAAFRSALSPSFCRFSRSSSLALDRMPAERDTDPPVMDPPALSTWPSRVTMRKRWPNFRAMAMALSMSLAMTTRPSRLEKMPAYCRSKEMSVSPIPKNPSSFSTALSRNSAGRTVFMGRKVARPPSRRLR